MGNRILLTRGDITLQAVDAIVNAANSSLLGGGGVDGAIHRAGGPAILEACKVIIRTEGACLAGEAVITTAGNLPARYVIHTVGPVWRSGVNNEAQLLANCYTNSLSLAIKHDAKTIAFPNISTGVYGYPKPAAASIAITTVSEFLVSNEKIETVSFVCYDQENYLLYESLLQQARVS
jgi:O-acetyl-ADP-ribose deacetylase (regulator of RNase III)